MVSPFQLRARRGKAVFRARLQKALRAYTFFNENQRDTEVGGGAELVTLSRGSNRDLQGRDDRDPESRVQMRHGHFIPQDMATSLAQSRKQTPSKWSSKNASKKRKPAETSYSPHDAVLQLSATTPPISQQMQQQMQQ
jgi:hypothetical protein